MQTVNGKHGVQISYGMVRLEMWLIRLSKPRVRSISSGAVVGLKNVCSFRRYGVKGA